MSVPFLANMTVLSGDKKNLDDAVKQVLQMADRLYNPRKELFDHDLSVTSGDYDPRFYWGRASGWALMAIAELLDILPEDYTGLTRWVKQSTTLRRCRTDPHRRPVRPIMPPPGHNPCCQAAKPGDCAAVGSPGLG